MTSWRCTLRDLFKTEEVPWRPAARALVRPPAAIRPGRLSGKAVFWSAAAILISLALGHLT